MNWNEKYRPKTFTEISGHREALTQIEGFILSGDIPHLLFYGEPGTCKTTIAGIIANKLLGDNHNGNFIELNASDERKIEDMRKIVIRAIKHMPLFAKMKVILFDEADGLTPDAQNILKRPMEKTRSTLFIFTCNNPEAIITPIKSRCAVFEFKPLPESDIIEGLKRIAVKEKLVIDDNTLQGIARKVKGDMRSAVNELQKASACNNRSIEIDRIVQQYMKQPAGAIMA
ncbi:MAG: AAA family ATPase [Methanolobus sp.]|uniref:AAA family ATPase n=1 Tax=Methanolobus sp. TaxID=1874737 RepID=UPI00272FFE21|nr:AAA family ATPase [Methanolobus sp.]MDP2217156.1 AAA family ATPase [Methanolobus sp.]